MSQEDTTKRANVLVVDDDVAITTLITAMLTKAGYAVTAVNDPRRALDMNLKSLDLIICDVMMPHIDGFKLVTTLRTQTSIPIVFLTAKVSEDDAVHGYATGADDYIRKPFSMAELIAKVDAQIRRKYRSHHNALIFNNLSLDLVAQKATVDGSPIPLTTTEWFICEYLATHPGITFSREQIADAINASVFTADSDSNMGIGSITDSEPTTEQAVAMHISNIRAKFRARNIAPIKTVWGIGYRWIA